MCSGGEPVVRKVLHVENFRTFLRCIKLWARRRGIYSNIIGFPDHRRMFSAAWCRLHALLVNGYHPRSPLANYHSNLPCS